MQSEPVGQGGAADNATRKASRQRARKPQGVDSIHALQEADGAAVGTRPVKARSSRVTAAYTAEQQTGFAGPRSASPQQNGSGAALTASPRLDILHCVFI